MKLNGLPLESTTGALSILLNGPILLCHKILPEKTSRASTRALAGTVTYRRPLFPGVMVKFLSNELKSCIHQFKDLHYNLYVITHSKCLWG